jgi:hypothetical protein
MACAAAGYVALEPLALARAGLSLRAPSAIEATPGQVVILTGSAFGAPPGAKVALQLRAGERWRTLLQTPIRRERFRLRWRVPTSVVASLRFAVLDRGRVLAASEPVAPELGEARFECELPHGLPQPPGPPPGKGLIRGEVVAEGGVTPASACGTGMPRIVSLVDGAGAVVSQETIAGRQGYEFVVPPGSFTVVTGLHGECRASVVVFAVRVTHADVVCPTS